MADFRKVLVALAVLVIAAGMANAQTYACLASVANPPQLRSEGLTEEIGDIVLDCTGLGSNGLANITVYLPAPVTSRVAAGNSGLSEALLIINEPAPGASSIGPSVQTNDPLPGVGPGCTGFGAVSGGTLPTPTAAATACTYNTFQGIISIPSATPSVTFLGVPVVPQGTVHRIYRITNIRANANAYAGGTTGVVPLTVQVSISGTTAMPLNQTSFVAGYVTKSMVFDGLVSSSGSQRSGFSYQQCVGVNAGSSPSSSMSAPPSNVTTYIQYRELFATAFRPRGSASQTGLGVIYNTESGLTVTGTIDPSTSVVSAVASYGTRLRAIFNNIPLGTEVWVATDNFQAPGIAGSAITGSAHLTTGSSTGSYAASGDTWVNVVASTATSGVAIWEILSNTNTNALELYDFGVFLKAVPAPQTSPAVGVQGTVTGNYAPTPSSTQVTAWNLAMTGTIPRFNDPGTTYNLVSFTICRTNLLFPYVLGGVAGFDTGIAITNTSKDPWGTIPQSGTCLLNFYGTAAPAVFTTPSIGSKTTDFGVIWSSTAMSLATGFNGYIIAQCNFQYGHGFAFVSDIGAHNLAMGYLALILGDIDGIGARSVNGTDSLFTAESLSN